MNQGCEFSDWVVSGICGSEHVAGSHCEICEKLIFIEMKANVDADALEVKFPSNNFATDRFDVSSSPMQDEDRHEVASNALRSMKSESRIKLELEQVTIDIGR